MSDDPVKPIDPPPFQFLAPPRASNEATEADYTRRHGDLTQHPESKQFTKSPRKS